VVKVLDYNAEGRSPTQPHSWYRLPGTPQVRFPPIYIEGWVSL